jgi:hypothetical protein
MQQQRIEYADFAVYPALIAVMILVIGDWASPVERAVSLAFVLGGAFLWTYLQYLLHRLALHGDSSVSEPQDHDHVSPGAWGGTPAWLSVAALVFVSLLLETLGVSLIASIGIAVGLVSAIHHGGVRLLAKGLLVTVPTSAHPSQSAVDVRLVDVPFSRRVK